MGFRNLQEKLENYLFRLAFELFKFIRADLNLQQQVKNINFQKIFWSFTVQINCFSDLKMFQILNLQLSIFKSFPRSLDQFFSHSRLEQFSKQNTNLNFIKIALQHFYFWHTFYRFWWFETKGLRSLGYNYKVRNREIWYRREAKEAKLRCKSFNLLFKKKSQISEKSKYKISYRL